MRDRVHGLNTHNVRCVVYVMYAHMCAWLCASAQQWKACGVFVFLGEFRCRRSVDLVNDLCVC